jgi:predicted nucleic acid-binding protein
LSLVIDASVALAWIFGDERHDAAWQVLERLREGPAWVPAHFHLEVGNGLLTVLRRSRLTTDQARTAVVALAARRTAWPDDLRRGLPRAGAQARISARDLG